MRPRTPLILLLAATTLLVALSQSAFAAPSVYWGALVGGAPPTAASFAPGGALATFEQQAGKSMSLVHWGQPWKADGQYLGFPADAMENVRRHGSIPVLNWASWDVDAGAAQPHFRLDDIVGGTFDPYITAWATQAKAWGQ